MSHERLLKQALFVKANGKSPVGGLELNGQFALKILDRIAWDYTQVK